ncbi:CwfJ C-terminus 1-domain-containing protein-like protein [Auriculariales sp. MPI-PUGE-AT-0066]|nr:CwfJ C-terminus 1-domain-containing protein-like protein [Auriculariales sp. MPI-PUGE-AT-0066]
MQGEYTLPPAVLERLQESASGVSEICPNVSVFAKTAAATVAGNLRIAVCGGKYDATKFKSDDADDQSPLLNSKAVDRLLSNPSIPLEGVDILLTHLWPISISQHSVTAPALVEYISNTAPPLDEVVRRARPRYHFAASGKPSRFWEREPFAWDSSLTRSTRFIGLGSFGEQEQPGTKKARWFYAFSIASGAQAAVASKTTQNPFSQSQPNSQPRSAPTKRTLEQLDQPSNDNFIWDMGNAPPPPKRTRIEQGQGESKRPPEGYKCRICESDAHFIKDCPDKPAKGSVPEGYVCKICQGTDHLIRDCPTKLETGDTGGKKPRPGYVCRACGSQQHLFEDCQVANQGRTERDQRPRGQRGPPKEIAPDECWFCLSNPRVTKHLITAIGSECYVTLPKGQIPDTTSNASPVPGGGHVLIVPIAHYPTISSAPQDVALPIITEMERYKSALRSFYAAYGCVPVIFEVSRLTGKGGHIHLQVVPVPKDVGPKVEDFFRSEGERSGVNFEENAVEALEEARNSQENYFRVDLPDGKFMLHRLRQAFNLQFPRAVIATLLGRPERVDWRACAQTDDQERADAQAFKKAFAQFDPAR